jgi:hypothetical protein
MGSSPPSFAARADAPRRQNVQRDASVGHPMVAQETFADDSSMLLRTALVLVALSIPAWHFDVPKRVQRASDEFRRHRLPMYAAGFLIAPQSELRPAAFTDGCAGCLQFDVDAPNARALEARLEFDSGATLPAAVRTERHHELLEFRLSDGRPVDAWLTWKPSASDPGFGVHPAPCGQALSEVGVRPARRGGGRVGVRLTISSQPDATLTYRLHGDQPYVP